MACSRKTNRTDSDAFPGVRLAYICSVGVGLDGARGKLRLYITSSIDILYLYVYGVVAMMNRVF